METMKSWALSLMLAGAFCAGGADDDGAGKTTNAAPVAAERAYVPPAEAQMSDREIWNKGYDFWKAGDSTNAVLTLQPLLLSRTHGRRAAELVGALRHAERTAERDRSRGAAGVYAEGAALEPLRRAVKAGEEAAAALQIALRATPDDPRAGRNFSRALQGLGEERAELHVGEVLAAAKNRDPKEQMATAAREALAILTAQRGVLTNEASVAVTESEALAKRTETLADALIPLKRQVLESVTNEQQAATIVGDVEATRDATLKAAEQLADLSPEASGTLATAENAFHRYWKGMLDPPTALEEGLKAQTNAVAKTEPVNGRDWQREALEFTQILGSGFQAWAQQACAQDAAAASNRPPFTMEVAQNVMTAIQGVAKTQEGLVKDPRADQQALALAGLNRVRERCGLIAGQPPQLIDADLLAQANAYMDVKRTDGFDWQRDAFDATRAFRAKFPAWAQRKAQEIEQKRQQGNTNVVAFTQEAQAEITGLAAQAEKKQEKMVKTVLPPDQEEILRMLARIRDLLPRDENGGNGQQNQQQDQQNQQQDQQKNEQDQQKNEQDQQPEPRQEPKEQQAQQEEPKDQKDVEDLLRKAQERNDEHENEKKLRMRRAPLAPNERDW